MKTGKWCFCPACVNQRPALEALLNASMFEEKLGMQAQSMFGNIEDDQYNRLYDVRAHGTERLSLNRHCPPPGRHHRGFERHRRIERIGAIERWLDGACPIMEDKTIRHWMTDEFQCEQIRGLALVPA